MRRRPRSRFHAALTQSFACRCPPALFVLCWPGAQVNQHSVVRRSFASLCRQRSASPQKSAPSRGAPQPPSQLVVRIKWDRMQRSLLPVVPATPVFISRPVHAPRLPPLVRGVHRVNLRVSGGGGGGG